MAGDDAQIQVAVLFENLSNSLQPDDQLKTLQDLEIIISKKYNVVPIFATISLESLFECSQSDNQKVRRASTRLLKKVLESLDPIETTANYKEKIIFGLSRDEEEFKLLCIGQIERLSSISDGISFLVQNNVILEKVAETISCNYLSVAKVASKIMLNVALDEQRFKCLFSETIKKIFWNLLQEKSIVRYRVYELYVEILQLRIELFSYVQSTGVVTSLINELDSSDILSVLNCLEMLSNIASSSSEGLQFIHENEVLSKLDRIIKSAETGPSEALLLPGAIKFFGSIARTNPVDILSTFPSFVIAIYENLTGSDPALVCLCAETLAIIASTDDGLKFLYENPTVLKDSMKLLGKIVQRSADENTRTRILAALFSIFSCDHGNGELQDIMEKLFRNLGLNPLTILWDLCKQPFPNLRRGSLGVISGIVKYSWGEQELALTAGFLEYLLDRNTEVDKEGKELKYAIMKSLSISTTAQENIGRDYYDHVCQYVRDGPFYSGRDAAVSFESLD